MKIITENIATPLGTMLAATTEQGICLFEFPYRRSIDNILARVVNGLGAELETGTHPYLDMLRNQVQEYFTGIRQHFDLPLHLVGSDFQKNVWQGLLHIPYGETRSYKQQSIFLGNEKAIRAIAAANGQNGIAIIIPCHRVIGENGSLTGYGGGLRNKQWLLNHERKYSNHNIQISLFADSDE